MSILTRMTPTKTTQPKATRRPSAVGRHLRSSLFIHRARIQSARNCDWWNISTSVPLGVGLNFASPGRRGSHWPAVHPGCSQSLPECITWFGLDWPQRPINFFAFSSVITTKYCFVRNLSRNLVLLLWCTSVCVYQVHVYPAIHRTKILGNRGDPLLWFPTAIQSIYLSDWT